MAHQYSTPAASSARSLAIVAGSIGQHASIVLEAALPSGAPVVLFLAKSGRHRFSVPSLGTGELLRSWDFLRAHALPPAAGDPLFRRCISDAAVAVSGRLGPVLHPTAVVAPSAAFGMGCVAFGGRYCGAKRKVGDLSAVLHASVVGHDGLLEPGVNLCPGARPAGAIVYREHAFIGMVAVVMPGKMIGKRAIVGAGAFAISDIPDKTTVVGNPACPVIRRGRLP